MSVCCLVGCKSTPETTEVRIERTSEVQAAIASAKATDPGLQRFFDTAAGYAVFPKVGKGAVGVGGAYGRGELFERGRLVGYCSLTQATVGLALGGQTYTELIFFEDQAALDRFKSGNYAFAAQASAVGAQIRRLGQCQVCRGCRGLRDGRERPDGRGLPRRAEVQIRADRRSGAAAGYVLLGREPLLRTVVLRACAGA